MTLFEAILIFIRASREQSWNMHLNNLHKLCPYLFGFDMISYSCMTPVYLAHMYKLKEKDQTTWQLLGNGGFSVNKSGIPFTATLAELSRKIEQTLVKLLPSIFLLLLKWAT